MEIVQTEAKQDDYYYPDYSLGSPYDIIHCGLAGLLAPNSEVDLSQNWLR